MPRDGPKIISDEGLTGWWRMCTEDKTMGATPVQDTSRVPYVHVRYGIEN